MMAWLLGKGALGLARWAWLLAALAGIMALLAAITGSVRDSVQTITSTAHEAGANSAVVAGQNATLDQIGEAHAAANDIRNDRGSARYDQCLQDVAPGYASSCERYRPQQPVPGDAADSAAPGPDR